jgi:hypothetical protein
MYADVLQELTIRQETGDLRGECCAHGHLGHVHTSMGNYLSALKSYQASGVPWMMYLCPFSVAAADVLQWRAADVIRVA